MSLGGKVRPKEQTAPRTPEASAPHAGGQDDARAQIRSHVRQTLLHARDLLRQGGSGPSTQGN